MKKISWIIVILITVLVVLLPNQVVAQEIITNEMIYEAAREVVFENIAMSNEVSQIAGEVTKPPEWRNGIHYGCLGALIMSTFVDIYSTEEAILAGGTELNPIFSPFVANRRFTDFRYARLGIGVGAGALLYHLYASATNKAQRSVATAACGIITGVTILAGRQNLRVARELGER